MKVNIVIKEEDYKDKLIELSNILLKLREKTKYWQEHFGGANRVAMKRWEDKADEWINNYIQIENSP